MGRIPLIDGIAGVGIDRSVLLGEHLFEMRIERGIRLGQVRQMRAIVTVDDDKVRLLAAEVAQIGVIQHAIESEPEAQFGAPHD